MVLFKDAGRLAFSFHETGGRNYLVLSNGFLEDRLIFIE